MTETPRPSTRSRDENEMNLLNDISFVRDLMSIGASIAVELLVLVGFDFVELLAFERFGFDKPPATVRVAVGMFVALFPGVNGKLAVLFLAAYHE
ncbi:unnamed protein product [Rotaria socialis]|uniref:Uncharacterized protein n=1 Tax=Rotaria socialis TaxID=392032 RepID=A0A817VSP5_9BILA|nr:unnamed protein product [Rotaria socialis]